MIEKILKIQNKVAVLIMGTYREIEFLLRLFPYMAGSVEYDIFVVLRHVKTTEKSRLGSQEDDFNISKLVNLLNEKIFVCELPNFDQEAVRSKYLTPVGPNSIEKECGIISMFYGVFTAVSMVKSSLREYTHVFKIRTDYQPRITPWISGIIDYYEESEKKIVVDYSATIPTRYPDRNDIPWQGSISDLLFFSSTEQFFQVWDIEDLLPSVWTGEPETTLFRAAMIRLLGDELQSSRRNKSFLEEYFVWEKHEIMHPKKEPKSTLGQSVNIMRAGILSTDLKNIIVEVLQNNILPISMVNKLIRFTYDYISSNRDEKIYMTFINDHLDKELGNKFIDLSIKAKNCYSPT